jgi:hypothetical protein
MGWNTICLLRYNLSPETDTVPEVYLARNVQSESARPDCERRIHCCLRRQHGREQFLLTNRSFLERLI